MERNSTNRLRLGAATLLLGAAMGVSAQDANVKLGVVQVGNELQVQFMPDQNVNLPVTASQFTVSWNNPNVSLGTEEWMSEAVATYMQGFALGTLYLGTRQDNADGGNRYATFTQESLGGNASWTANTPVSILRIPISNPGNECVVFSVVDDA